MILEEQDIARIADAISQRLGSTEQVNWMTKQEAASYLRCSVRQLEKLVHRGEIPHYKPAGRSLFRASDLDAHITNRRAA